MIYWELFLGFLKVGLFSFGGAYAAIPLMRDVVLSYGWIGDDMLSYMIAVSESTPGPVMVNLATYIGSSQAGLPGALIATGTVILPAFVIILLVMAVLKKLLDNPYAQAVLDGLKSCVIGVILATGAYMILEHVFSGAGAVPVDYTALVLTAVLAVLYYGSRKIMKKGISPVGLIGISALLGILVYGWR